MRLRLITDCAFQDLECFIADCENFFFHMRDSSYVAGVYESKNKLFVKHCIRTSCPSHNCSLSITDFSSNNTKRKRCLNTFKKRLSKMDNESKVCEQMLWNCLMFETSHVLYQFSFVNLYASVKIYAIFIFKPKHSLELELSKLLLEFIFNYLTGQDRSSLAVRYQWGQPKRFSAFRETALKLKNDFLKNVGRHHVPRNHETLFQIRKSTWKAFKFHRRKRNPRYSWGTRL